MHDDRHGKGYFDENDHRRGIALNGMAGVFGLMFVGLFISAVTAMFTAGSQAMQDLLFNMGPGIIVLAFAPFLMVIFVFPRVWKMQAGTAVLVFFIFAILIGITLSGIFYYYDLGTITLAFLSAAGMFGVMALFGAITKADLSGIRSFLMMGFFGFIIATVINIFLGSTMMDTIITYAGIAIFLGLTAYNVQRLKHAMATTPGHGVMVLGALHLYLDFVNIFLLLLRLMGRRR